MAIDFFTVPTATFRGVFVFVVLAHQRRRVIHFNVTAHPTAEWTAQPIVEAFPWDTAPRYVRRDRDGIYGDDFRQRVHGMGIDEVRSAPRSPWQNPYVERVIGSIRRDCEEFTASYRLRSIASLDWVSAARTSSSGHRRFTTGRHSGRFVAYSSP